MTLGRVLSTVLSGLAVVLFSAPATAQIAPTERYLLAFHACEPAVTCPDPANHRVYLAESNDGATWTMVPNWTTFAGSVPDVIQRGRTVYVFAVAHGQVARYNIDTNTSDRVSVTVTGLPNGRTSDWVDPSLYLDDQGRLVLFFLYAPLVGGDPARCPTGQTTCTSSFCPPRK